MATLTRDSTRSPMAAPRTTKKSFWKLANPYLYLLPAAIVMAVMSYYPMIYGIWMSFTDYGLKNLRVGSAAPNFVGLQNYIDIITSNVPQIANFDFVYTLMFNLFWTFSNVIFHVVIGVLIAVLLNAKGLWFKGIYRAIYILPIVLPTLVIGNIWRNMFDPDFGAINQGLAMVGSIFSIPAATF